jgi:DNA polymerase III alpha subunit
MTDVFSARHPDEYTDDAYVAAEAARVKAAVDRTVSNADVLRAVEKLQERLDQYDSAISQAVTIAEEVKVKVDPFLASLQSHPMLRMFLGKVK